MSAVRRERGAPQAGEDRQRECVRQPTGFIKDRFNREAQRLVATLAALFQ